MFNTSTSKSILNTFLFQIISKGIGYIKYLLFAFLFGISMEMDAYNMALTIIDVTLFVLGHAFSVVGVPRLVKAREKSIRRFKELSGSIFIFSLIVSIFLIPLQYLFFENLVSILAPGFNSEKANLTYELFQHFLIMSVVYLPYFALISFFRALNLFKISNFLDFLIAIFSMGYLYIFMNNGIAIIPSSLSFAYIITIIIALIIAYRYKVIGFYGSLYSSNMKIIYKNILKLSLWFLVLQLYRVVDKGFASLLDDGMISALVYASILITGISFVFDFAYVYLTKFSEKEDKSKLFTLAIKLYLFLSIPIISYILMYSFEFISFVYGNGNFNEEAIFITSEIILILSPLLFLSLINSLFQSFYQSLEKYLYIIVLSFIGVSINFSLNYLLIDKYGIEGIAFATVFSTSFILVLNLMIISKKEKIFLDANNIFKEFSKYIFIAVVLILISYSVKISFILESLLFFTMYLGMLVLFRNEFIIKLYKILRK